jgi:hypothetical protein
MRARVPHDVDEHGFDAVLFDLDRLGQMLRCLVVVRHDPLPDHSRRPRRERREMIAIGRERSLLGESHSADRRFGDPEVVRTHGRAIVLREFGEQRGVTFMKRGETIRVACRKHSVWQRLVGCDETALAALEKPYRLRTHGARTSLSMSTSCLCPVHALDDAAPAKLSNTCDELTGKRSET